MELRVSHGFNFLCWEIPPLKDTFQIEYYSMSIDPAGTKVFNGKYFDKGTEYLKNVYYDKYIWKGVVK